MLARVVCEQYFTKVDQSRIFLGHRLGGMKMRWVHCSAVSKAEGVEWRVLERLPLNEAGSRPCSANLIQRKATSHNSRFLWVPVLEWEGFSANSMREEVLEMPLNQGPSSHSVVWTGMGGLVGVKDLHFLFSPS